MLKRIHRFLDSDEGGYAILIVLALCSFMLLVLSLVVPMLSGMEEMVEKARVAPVECHCHCADKP